MSLADALNRLETHRVEPFVAPILDADRNVILVVQNNTPSWLTYNGVQPGWWKLRAHRGNHAVVLGEAQPVEYCRYLDALPKIYVIAVHRLAPHTWLVVPYGAADASQRGWIDCAPRVMHLVRDSIKYLDVLDARILGDQLLYHQITLRNLPFSDTFIVAREMALAREDERRKQAIREAYEQQRNSLEHQLVDSVEFMGAQIVNWGESGENIQVTWEWNGYRNTTTVARSLSVQSVGFCADGSDAMHNLTSAVALLQEGVRQQHYAVYREEL